MKRPISNRDDISELVNDFYDRIRTDDLLGVIFNETIDDWDEHLDKLTDFWDSMLLGANNFKGRPMRAHFQVDAKYNHSISQQHFERWLGLWFATLDEKYVGDLAEAAKEKARNVAQITFIRLQESRKGRSLM